MKIPRRSEISTGQTVWGVEKKNYKSGTLTKGTVAQILTNKEQHPRGIKVKLTDGVVVRVQSLTPPTDDEPQTLDQPPANLSSDSILR